MRRKLGKFRININDVDNGVLLPANVKAVTYTPSLPGTVTSGIHTARYYHALHARLEPLTSGRAVRAELRKIAAELLTGTFPY
ncbi:AHH domain-containing protein [Deinococcus malanensis]|nr:AHH domain-containing protein [Deinococcus malanensis]